MNSVLHNIIDQREAAIREWMEVPMSVVPDMKKYLDHQKVELIEKKITPSTFVAKLRAKTSMVLDAQKMIADQLQTLLKDKMNVVAGSGSYSADDVDYFIKRTHFFSSEYLSIGVLFEKQFEIGWAEYYKEIQKAMSTK